MEEILVGFDRNRKPEKLPPENLSHTSALAHTPKRKPHPKRSRKPRFHAVAKETHIPSNQQHPTTIVQSHTISDGQKYIQNGKPNRSLYALAPPLLLSFLSSEERAGSVGSEWMDGWVGRGGRAIVKEGRKEDGYGGDLDGWVLKKSLIEEFCGYREWKTKEWMDELGTEGSLACLSFRGGSSS